MQDKVRRIRRGHSIQCRSLALLIRPAVEEKKLFLWNESLVEMDCSLLTEIAFRIRRVSCNLPSLQGLYTSGDLKHAGKIVITYSAERMIRCNLPLSLTVAAKCQMVIEEARMDSMISKVHHCYVEYLQLQKTHPLL